MFDMYDDSLSGGLVVAIVLIVIALILLLNLSMLFLSRQLGLLRD